MPPLSAGTYESVKMKFRGIGKTHVYVGPSQEDFNPDADAYSGGIVSVTLNDTYLDNSKSSHAELKVGFCAPSSEAFALDYVQVEYSINTQNKWLPYFIRERESARTLEATADIIASFGNDVIESTGVVPDGINPKPYYENVLGDMNRSTFMFEELSTTMISGFSSLASIGFDCLGTINEAERLCRAIKNGEHLVDTLTDYRIGYDDSMGGTATHWPGDTANNIRAHADHLRTLAGKWVGYGQNGRLSSTEISDLETCIGIALDRLTGSNYFNGSAYANVQAFIEGWIEVNRKISTLDGSDFVFDNWVKPGINGVRGAVWYNYGGPGDSITYDEDKSFIVAYANSLADTEYTAYSGGVGTSDDPYQISTVEDLIELGNTPADYDKHYILTNDIAPTKVEMQEFSNSGWGFDTLSLDEFESWFFDGKTFEKRIAGNHSYFSTKSTKAVFTVEAVDFSITISVNWNFGGKEAYIDQAFEAYNYISNEWELLDQVRTSPYRFYSWQPWTCPKNSVTAAPYLHSSSADLISSDGHYLIRYVLIEHSYIMSGDTFYKKTQSDTFLKWQNIMPIGNEDMPFTGGFDGQGYTIHNVLINQLGVDHVGLFGRLGHDGEIRNLNLENATVTEGSNVGCLVGYSEGTIEECHVTGSVSSVGSESNTGGLVGINSGSINNCDAICSVSGSGNIGGLIGLNSADIIDCSASGSVNGSGDIGGLLGSNSGSVSNCGATGSVNGGGTLGGLCGINNGTVSKCKATGNLITDSDKWTIDLQGGLVGWNNTGVIRNCYATGSITGRGDQGGLCGSNNGAISNCYAIGSVTGFDSKGGLVVTNHAGSISNSYWDTENFGWLKLKFKMR